MQQRELANLMRRAGRICRAAGDAILAVPRHEADAQIKGDGSPVTRADKAADTVMERELTALTPDLPVVSEEGDLKNIAQRALDRHWLIDPLDGTKEFLKGNGEYTVNAALVEEGVPVLGVVYAPATDRLWCAARGEGAWKSAGGGDLQPIHPNDSPRPLVAAISRSHPSPQTDAMLKRLGVARVVKSGSSLKMCLVAEGEADVYPRLAPTHLWDTAAGAAVAREAGCRVVDADGADLLYDLRRGLIHASCVVCTERVYSQLSALSAHDH